MVMKYNINSLFRDNFFFYDLLQIFIGEYNFHKFINKN
jgi:hypothetical protein